MSLSPIRVGPSGRYFQTFQGEPFLFLGANDALAWPGLEPLLGRRDLTAVEDYLRSLADNGATILRIMLEYVHDDRFFFENPVGHFVPEIVTMWDDLFDLCEKVGLRILLTPWDSFWMALRWDHHPYNNRNGGPASSPDAFFSDEATIQATLNRVEFVVNRWRGRAVLAAWDLWNEIHPHYGGPAERQSPIIERQSRFVRAAEERLQGWTRPQNGFCVWATTVRRVSRPHFQSSLSRFFFDSYLLQWRD